MRLFNFLALSVLSLTALAAKNPAAAKFDKFHKQFSSSPPISLDDISYEELTTGARDYSVAVLLTALDPKYVCGVCRDFQSEWNLLARSWQKGDKKGQHRVLIGTLDFDKGKTTFIRVGSNKIEEEYQLMLTVTNTNRTNSSAIPSHRWRKR